MNAPLNDHRPTVTEVVAKLQTYGSADQLAAFFEQEGVCGNRDLASSCPVANYTRSQIGARVIASQSYVLADSDGSDFVDLDPGTAVPEFITKFDRGEYPALVQVSD